MKPEEKRVFDHLNQSSYLLRILLQKLNIDISPIYIMSDTVWHVLYKEAVIGTITFRTDEEGFTYCNIRLYKYIKQKVKDIPDFIMSEYYEVEDGKKVRFKFEKFNKYFETITTVFDKELPQENETTKIHSSLEDSISRLTEYCDEYDQKFSQNMIIHDIMNVLKENERLSREIKKKTESVMDLFVKI